MPDQASLPPPEAGSLPGKLTEPVEPPLLVPTEQFQAFTERPPVQPGVEPAAEAQEAPAAGRPSQGSPVSDEFRFPAEDQEPTSEKKPMSWKRRLFWWAVVSLAIVAFFALLVNLILPGPSGRKPPVHTTPQTEQTAPKPPAGKP